MIHWSTCIDSPVGVLGIEVSSDGELRRVEFLDGERSDHRVAPPESASAQRTLETVVRQLEEYFAGTRKVFRLPLGAEGTPFQRSVWSALCTIPYGETTSYGELARRLGNPKATRAVGAANGRNPISIIVPCHRVIGADGSLTGFGGGLHRKRTLLAWERGERTERASMREASA